jgi:predicted aminopeptidase
VNKPFASRLSLLALRTALTGALALWLGGCSSLGYYSQLGSGQWRLLQAREPVAAVIDDPTRDPHLRAQLAQAQKARDFASAQLHLPDNRSYRLYADIQRPYVVWNVFATPEFSLSPQTHCFPIAGCVAYRGYYSQGAARGEAALQRQQGMDVYIGGVEAYSTLGWFDEMGEGPSSMSPSPISSNRRVAANGAPPAVCHHCTLTRRASASNLSS